MLGQTLNYADLSKFEWNKNHINMLNKYKVENPKTSLYLLLVQTEDELIDYKIAVNYLKGSQQIVEDGGDHSFINIEQYKNDIINFLFEQVFKMNFKKYKEDWLNLKFDKNSRIVFLTLYAIIMFSTIESEINIIFFVLLFIVAPISIYYIVKYIFPKE